MHSGVADAGVETLLRVIAGEAALGPPWITAGAPAAMALLYNNLPSRDSFSECL